VELVITEQFCSLNKLCGQEFTSDFIIPCQEISLINEALMKAVIKIISL
jgi:hypothetical protein